jgi:ATP-dependent helicase/nuclease subunit A
MTRAEDRLIVGGWNTKKTASDAAWHPLIVRALDGFAAVETDPELQACGLADAPVSVLRHRSAQTRPPRAAETAPPAPAVPSETDPAWLWTDPTPDPRPSRPLAPSEAPADPPPVSPLDAETAKTRFRRGILVHRLLQHLPALPPEDRDPAARAWLTGPAHGLDPATADALADEVLAVLEDPALAPVFGPGSRAEVPIVGVVGQAVVSGQVDRLHVADDRVTVVDFKTSRPAPTDPDKVSAAYYRQMALYRAVLTQVYPDRAIACALVWTAGPGLMVLDPARLDAVAL